MKKIKYYFVIFLITYFLVAYSEISSAQAYKKSGISVETPSNWKLTNDSNFINKRKLSFSTGSPSTGEYSFVVFRVYPKSKTNEYKYKNLTLPDFLSRDVIPLITAHLFEDSYKLISSSISRPPFIGTKIQMKYFNRHDFENTEAEYYLITSENAKIYASFFSVQRDLPNVTPAIQDILKSLKYVGG